MNLRLSNEAWEAMLKAHSFLMRSFAAEKIWGELSMSEYDVLYTLAKAAGPLRLGQLREEVLLSQPALSRLVERLRKRGLVESEVEKTDRRALSIKLTETGRSLQKAVGRAHARSVQAHLAKLSPTEMKELKRLSQKLTNTHLSHLEPE